MPTATVLGWVRLVILGLALGGVAAACGELGNEQGDTESDASVPTLSGELDVRVLDRERASEVQYRLLGGEGERVKLLFETDPQLRSGAEIAVWGTWLDERTLSVTSWERLARQKRLDAPLTRTPKLHRVAILAMQEAAVTEQDALRAANGDTSSLRHFMAETTHGVDTFSADIFRRYRVNYTQSDCLYDNSDRLWDLMVEAFRAGGGNPDAYDHIAVIVPRACGSDWSGAWASVGGIRNDGSLRFGRTSVYKDNAFDAWYLAHELGHNLGMHHSQSIHCGQALYNRGATGCSVDEYGNYNDVMGWGEGVYWGTPHQRFMGWIDADEVVTAGRSGTFYLQPADEVTCGIRALRIPIPSEPGYYFYLEYRRARSTSLYAGTGAVGGTRSNALLITRSQDGASDQSFNQRVDLRTSRYEGARAGQRYDLGSGVVVEVLSMTGASASVKVTMPGSAVHRRDDGVTQAAAADGTVGLATCGGGGSDLCPNDPNKTAPGACGCGVPEGTCGGGTSVRYEAEARTGAVGCVQSSSNGGFSGTGFMDFGGNGTWIEWNAIKAVAAGSYELSFRYANGSGGNRSAAILVNGSSAGTLTFTKTGSWTTWNTQNIVVSLRAGDNLVRVSANSSAGGPNIDYVLVTPRGVTDLCPSDPNKTAPGTCGCGVADNDTDRDGTFDCKDGCPSDAAKIAKGACGCGVPEGTCSNTATIRLDKSTFAVGEAIVVNYSNLPGNALDWVGTYAAGTANSAYLQYLYTNGSKNGTLRFNSLPKGKYEARLFFNDSYDLKGTVTFTVIDAPTGGAGLGP